jgi:hypothetical protein
MVMDIAQQFTETLERLKIELVNKSVAQEEAHIYFNALLDIAENEPNNALVQEIVEHAMMRVREQTAQRRAALLA